VVFDTQVIRLLLRFGKDVTVTHVVDGTYNPSTGQMGGRSETTESITGYLYTDRTSQTQSSLVSETPMAILSPLIVTPPETGSKVEDKFIVSVRAIEDKGEVVCWICELGGSVTQIFESIAHDAVTMTPVDTGAAVTSFSYKANRSSGRSRTSRGKPRRQNVAAMRKIGYDQLMEDLTYIDFNTTQTVTLSNGSPHWRIFNNNKKQGTKIPNGRWIFENIAAKYRNATYRARN